METLIAAKSQQVESRMDRDDLSLSRIHTGGGFVYEGSFKEGSSMESEC